MNLLHTLALLLEIVVTVLGLLIALQRGKPYGWLIALTFGIYVFYDLMRFVGLAASMATLLDILFLLASAAITWAAVQLYRSEARV